MALVLAGAVGSFFLYALLGGLALVVTAALDRKIGKERALLLWAVVILVLTFVWKSEAPTAKNARPKSERDLPIELVDVKGNPFARPDFEYDVTRNVFQKYSDTRKLPPVELEAPPWIDFEFPLAPTIPGPAPAARGVLSGQLPQMGEGGASVPEIPAAAFKEYTPQPEDIYDWIQQGGRRTYVHVLAIRPDGGSWVESGELGEANPEFESLLMQLANRADPKQREGLEVRLAIVGNKERAAGKLTPEEFIKARRTNVSERTFRADAGDDVYPRRTARMIYAETARLVGSNAEKLLASEDISRLRRVAERMGEVGQTGKEGKAGWRYAVQLLERAREVARQGAADSTRAEILRELIEAYRALNDERSVLMALSEYATVSSASHDPWLLISELVREGLGLAPESLEYAKLARQKARSNADVIIAEGRAYQYGGQHEEAYGVFRKDSSAAAKRAQAEALLRLGRIEDAISAADSAIGKEPHPHAVLVRGAALYAKGDLSSARSAFESVATDPTALRWRAYALYNLALTHWRLGDKAAVEAAAAACRTALEWGAARSPIPDEAVSPSLPLALVALSAGDETMLSEQIEAARTEAPRSSYVEFLAGVISRRARQVSQAERSFARALHLAPDYAVIDGWLSEVYLRIAKGLVDSQADPERVAEAFNKSIAFAKRAASAERRVNPKDWQMRLRLALIQCQAEHLPSDERNEAALATVQGVLSRVDALNPAAFCIKAYAHYGLGGDENVLQCMRDFNKALEETDNAKPEFAEWRAYAEKTLDVVKHWYELVEQTITFQDDIDQAIWRPIQVSNEVLINVENGALEWRGQSKNEGSMEDPTVAMASDKFFRREQFEELAVEVKIPRRDRSGDATNNITWGVQILASMSKSRTGLKDRSPGIGIFYDKGNVAIRAGGGKDEYYKEGKPRRVADGSQWPSDDWVRIRIQRLDEETGAMRVLMGPVGGELTEVFKDEISGFRGNRGKGYLWLGGWSTIGETYRLEVRNMRIIRKEGAR